MKKHTQQHIFHDVIFTHYDRQCEDIELDMDEQAKQRQQQYKEFVYKATIQAEDHNEVINLVDDRYFFRLNMIFVQLDHTHHNDMVYEE